jgi:cysteinyl-tRNA synthetase
MSKEEESLLNEAGKFAVSFDAAMDDDFNTADAITAVFELVKFINLNAQAENSAEYLNRLLKELTELTDILGLIVDKEEELLDSDIEALIEERKAARKNKDFKRADEIRDSLLEMGIVLEDTREGVKWHRA